MYWIETFNRTFKAIKLDNKKLLRPMNQQSIFTDIMYKEVKYADSMKFKAFLEQVYHEYVYIYTIVWIKKIAK